MPADVVRGGPVGRRIVPGIVVAGIAVEHELPDGWDLGPDPYPAWESHRPVFAPVRVRHEVGDGAGLRLLIDSPETQESYYADDQGELAVRFGARRAGERDQWMRTVRAGHEYVLQYADESECGTRRWRWERTVVMYALASRPGGVMAHAAGFIAPDGGGVLCPGASGIGKSTIASQVAESLGRGAIVSDDRVGLTAGGSGPRVWGTPWHSSGGFTASADAPLRAIVLPSRSGGAPPAFRPLSASAALPRILKSLAAPFWSAASMDAMLETLDAVLREVPVAEYSYTPAPGAAEPLLRALRALG